MSFRNPGLESRHEDMAKFEGGPAVLGRQKWFAGGGFKTDIGLTELINKKNGFFVEVGAGDGISQSNTLDLERTGWQGILIEPVIEQCAHCVINRPKSAVLNYECVAHDNADEQMKQNQDMQQDKLQRTKGNKRTLAAILEELDIKKIDLMVLNGNGHDLEVLEGLGLFNNRPDYILVEEGLRSEIPSYLADYYYEPLEAFPNNSRGQKVLYKAAENKPAITSDKSMLNNINLKLLERAWDIAARSNASYPGKYIAYYSLSVNGKHFPGERVWEDRWEYIGKVLRDACGGDFKEKRILELGCNLGLLNVWAAREGAICHGYEYESDILEGCKLMASAFGVADRCSWSQADFNSKAVTDKITDDFDVCTCLSVMNWVGNKDNLIDLLSRQKVILYEGHDSDEIEIERLRRAGFGDIQKIASSERKRSVFVAKKSSTPEKRYTWDNFEKQYGLKGIPYKSPNVRIGDGNRAERIYLKGPEVWKVRLTTEKNPAKRASPYQEAKILQMLKDVPNVCRFKAYLETPYCTVVIEESFSNIGTLDQVTIPPEFWNKVETQKHAVVKAVNDHGILHNDILNHNFLVNSNYDICLIDFDQAQLIQGLNDYEHGRYSRCSKPVVYHTAGDDKAGNLKKLETAWDIAAKSNASFPGRYVAYYSLNADEKFFHGEVSWADRWKGIGEALLEACDGDFSGKHIIELGCNMGLVCIWAARKGAICHGFDRYADILEACKLNASVFGVSDRCKWDVMDFSSETDCDLIRRDCDVCVCLSLMNWVRNKENLIDLLSRQKKVVYEGHEGDEIETRRLKSAGFSEIKKVAVSERGRSVFWARKGNIINKNSASKEEIPAIKNETRTLIEKMNSYKWYHSIKINKINENLVTPGRNYEGIWDIILKGMDRIDFNNKKVLDIGCRDGLFSFKAEKSGASEIIGIDNEISKGAVDFLIPLFNSKVKMFEINLYDMRKKDFGTFDIILFPGVLYHLRFPFWALKRISDLLNENGILLVETALCNVENNKSVLYCPVGNESPYEPTSVSFFNLKGLIDTLKTFDLHVFNQNYSTEKNSNIFRQVVLARKETMSIVYGENKFGYTKKSATKEVVKNYWYGKGQKFYE